MDGGIRTTSGGILKKTWRDSGLYYYTILT